MVFCAVGWLLGLRFLGGSATGGRARLGFADIVGWLDHWLATIHRHGCIYKLVDNIMH